MTAFSWSRSRPGVSDNQPQFSGVQDYTRAGDFQMNSSGYLVNSAGYYLMGSSDQPDHRESRGQRSHRSCNSTTISCRRRRRLQSPIRLNLPSTPTSGKIDPNDFANNPIAGAEIIGSGATLLPDAVATGTGTVGSLTDSTTLSSLGIASGDKIMVSDGTNTTTYTSTGTDTVGALINAINSGSAGNAAVTATLSGGSITLTGDNDTATITVTRQRC